MVDESVRVGDCAAADVDPDVIEAAADQVRREVLALRELGDRHAALNGQLRLLSAERDAVANEYRARYRQIVGGQFMNAALRQLGMRESLGGLAAGKKRRRRVAKKAPMSAPAG